MNRLLTLSILLITTTIAAAPAPPPYFGLFGPAALLEHTSLRSAPGTWIEYQLGTKDQRMRLQEVAGAPPGQRWLELLTTERGAESAALKLMVRGNDGTVERLIARMPGFPALELPLDQMTPTGAPTPGLALFATGTPRLATRETVTVPLGRYVCDRWEMRGRNGTYRFWITSDPRVPFNGAVKLQSPSGIALAVATGTDAKSQLPALDP